jgi:UDP-2,3-diacylglucosamine pyrophosphatase LpxH
VSTAIVSDLHLGLASGSDLLRHAPVFDALAGALADVDEVVLLGDLVELRERPVGAVLADVRPVLARLGEACDGKRITIVPGNHDHYLARTLLDAAADLSLETVAEPPRDGPLGAVASALGRDRDRIRIAYPGVWVRPDVFATHGHYLDVHNTVPSFERLAIGAVQRVAGRLPPSGPLSASDYEAAVTPVYSLTYAMAQSARGGRSVGGSAASVRLWRQVNGSGGGRIPALLLGRVALPAFVAGLNRAGLGPLKPDLSAVELREAALRGMLTVVERLGVDARHVIFGHTHRSGPHAGDSGWGPLMNTGSWIHEPAFLGRSPKDSPYWPGHVALVPDSGPPQLVSLLDELPM